MIPESKTDATTRALMAAFGVSEADDITKMTGGLSKALVFRIVVEGRTYLLRVVPDTDASLGPGQGDQTNHFACMRLAAEAGIGPKVWYTSPKDGISITDFVEARPFPRTTALALLPGTLRTLHALPPYPSPKVVNYLEGMGGLARKFQAAGMLPENESAELFELFGQATDAYPRDNSDLVSSHNDLRPENILFDGERPWLVDWEAAFLNDRYVDLAVVANFVVTNDAEQEAYLHAYFGEAAGEYRRARFFLMSQLLHVFYAAFLMLFGCKGKAIDSIAGAPDFRDFHERLRAGEIDLADEGGKLEYAKVHLNQALQDMRGVRFREALRIVAAGA
jgi:aminoglycoside phosphotransferase (APT) family kinase protein